MKTYTRISALALTAVLAGSACATAAPALPAPARPGMPVRMMKRLAASGPELVQRAKKIAAAPESDAPVMRPMWDEMYIMESGWTLIGRSDYRYDAHGNPVHTVIDDDGTVNTIINEYDDFGQRTLELTLDGKGDEAVNQAKHTYEYDPIVHDYYTRRMGYDWDGSAWTENFYCETNEITRNEEGNILQIIKSLPLTGSGLVPAYQSIWDYDENTSRANTYRFYTNSTEGTPTWELYNKTWYADIEWNRTDGQLTTDILEMVQGANRISKATVYYDGQPDGYIFVTYPQGDEPGYRMTMTTNNPEEIGMTDELSLLDADVYMLRHKVTEYFDEETGDITPEPTYIFYTDIAYDEHGNLLFTESYEYTPELSEPELVSGEKYTYTYDSDGNLTETVMSTYYYDDGEYFDNFRFVFGDYTDVSAGTATITGESLRIDGHTAYADGEILLCRTDGVTVARARGALPLTGFDSGVYILRCGSRIMKINL